MIMGLKKAKTLISMFRECKSVYSSVLIIRKEGVSYAQPECNIISIPRKTAISLIIIPF